MARRARWRAIYHELREAIAHGRYRPGEKLPTESVLARTFGVNRHTVRQAMGGLAEAGCVSIEQGRGTFVLGPVVDYPINARTRYSDTIRGAHREPGTRLIGSTTEPAGPECAEVLMLAEGVSLITLETLRTVDAVPLAVTTHYFPAARFEGLAEAFRERGSLTSALYAFGVTDYFRQRTRVQARLPTAEEARWLEQSASQPILEHRSRNLDTDQRPVEFAIGRYAGARARFVFEPEPMQVG
jgi:GntR family phosphonate transport system transcriptional regulator